MDIKEFDEMYVKPSYLEINAVNIDNTDVDMPSNIKNLKYVSADGIRMYHEYGIINTDDLQTEIDER